MTDFIHVNVVEVFPEHLACFAMEVPTIAVLQGKGNVNLAPSLQLFRMVNTWPNPPLMSSLSGDGCILRR